MYHPHVPDSETSHVYSTAVQDAVGKHSYKIRAQIAEAWGKKTLGFHINEQPDNVQKQFYDRVQYRLGNDPTLTDQEKIDAEYLFWYTVTGGILNDYDVALDELLED